MLTCWRARAQGLNQHHFSEKTRPEGNKICQMRRIYKKRGREGRPTQGDEVYAVKALGRVGEARLGRSQRPPTRSTPHPFLCCCWCLSEQNKPRTQLKRGSEPDVTPTPQRPRLTLAFSVPPSVRKLFFRTVPGGSLPNISPLLLLAFVPCSLCPIARLRRPEAAACNKQRFAREQSPQRPGTPSSELLWSGADRRAGAPFRRRRSAAASGDGGFLPSDGTKGRSDVATEKAEGRVPGRAEDSDYTREYDNSHTLCWSGELGRLSNVSINLQNKRRQQGQ